MVDNAQMIVDFDCNLFAGTTPAIQGGVTHRITMILSDSGGNILSQLDPVNVPVGCGTVANLGTVEFSLTP